MKEFKILKDLVKINTINDKGNKEFIEYISNKLKEKGFLSEIVSDSNGDSCLVAKTSDECNICFMGHSDTVALSGPWKTDPFELTEKDSYLYGLGACDMKSGIAAFLDAIDQIDMTTLNKGIMVIITYDEEIGFEGIKLIESRKDIPNNIIICEPTDLVPIVFCKGCIEYNVTFAGKAVHSAVMPRGENAILKACDFIKELNEIPKQLKNEVNNKFDIPYTTMNIATIKGGTCINMVPNQCELSFDFRTILDSHHDIIQSKVSELCSKYNCTYSNITNVFPSNNNDKKGVELIEKISNNKSTGMNYVTEGNFLYKKNVVIIGAGPITAHEIDEHISIESYRSTISVYKSIINNYCK